jgi:hypothetical protein
MFSRILIIISFYLFLQIISDYLLYSDDLIYDFLGDQLSYERIYDILNDTKKWKWATYLIIPLYLVIKFFFVTFCLSVGGLLIGLEDGFKKLFSITINAEFVLLIPFVIKLTWFSLFNTNYDLADLQNFSPLSVLSLFNQKEIESWMIYPLQLLNIFELLYWLTLSYQLKKITRKTFLGNFEFVASTYGVGLLLWVVFVIFLIVSLS